MSDEIKMFIDGEEVVSDREFTINEEMLSASSTILNNCYPKSWELDRDYISRFYYPKDYAKFLLGSGKYDKGLTEFTVLEATSKNLFNKNTMVINGALNAGDGVISPSDNFRTIYVPIKANTKYTLQKLPSNRFVMGYSNSYGTAMPQTLTNISFYDTGRTQLTFTTPSNVKVLFLMISKITEDTININDLLDSIQIELGDTATRYVPYGENISYETNVEKKWNSFNVYGSTEQEKRSGRNLYNYEDANRITSGVTVDNYGWITATYNNSSGSSIMFMNYWTNNLSLSTSTSYRIIMEVKSVSGTGSIRPVSVNGNSGQFTSTYGYSFSELSNNLIKAETKTTKASFTNVGDGIRTYIQFDAGQSGSITFRLSVLADTSVTPSNFVYEAYGSSPSPDYPSDLISVGYRNLIDINGLTRYPGYLDNNGQIYNSTTRQERTFDFLEVIPGQTYIFAIVETSDNTSAGYWFGIGAYKQNNESSFVSMVFRNSSPTNSVSFTVPSNARYIRISGRYLGGATKVQLEKGNVLHNYISYGKYGIVLKNNNQNLFNYKDVVNIGTNISADNDGWITASFNNSGGSSTNFQNYFTNNLKLETSKRYYIVLEIKNISGTGFIVPVSSVNTQGQFATGASYNFYTLSSNTIKITEATTKSSFDGTFWGIRTYVQFNAGQSGSITFRLSVVENADNFKYMPYGGNSQFYVLDEPLRSIDGIADRLYYDKGVLFVERKIGSIFLNGNENWAIGNPANRFFISINGQTDVNTTPMSNYYIGKTTNPSVNDNAVFLQNASASTIRINIYNKNYVSNLNGFKSWLATHNTEILYVLGTPIITPVGYADIPVSYEGKNYVEYYAGIDTKNEIFYNWKNFDVLFAGIVKNSGDISLNPRYPHYCSLQVLDYKTFLSESNTLDFVIANKTVKEAIEMVVNAVSGYGFIVGDINLDSANDVIGAYSTLNKTAYDVLQYLAEISNSRWRTRVIDSSTMAIDFYDPDVLPQVEDIEYTKEYWEANNIVDMSFNFGTRDYRNKQIMLSDEVYATINYDENLISNGYSNTFTLQNNIGLVISIIVNNEEKTFATTNDKQMGIDADFYYTPGKNVVESNGVYSAGTMIHLIYQPLVKGRQIVYNSSEVDRISNQTDTEGVIARYENRNDILSSDELEKIAKTYIDYKGKAEVILTLKTQNKDLYDIGEVVYFNAPINELKQNYMVKTKRINYVVIKDIINLFYEYELTSSFNSEKAINYFDNQRNKASGNISEGESITRNIDIETQASILWSEGSVSPASITVDGDNVLNSILNSPFIE